MKYKKGDRIAMDNGYASRNSFPKDMGGEIDRVDADDGDYRVNWDAPNECHSGWYVESILVPEAVNTQVNSGPPTRRGDGHETPREMVERMNTGYELLHGEPGPYGRGSF